MLYHIYQIKFVASKFEFSQESFGEIKGPKCWIIDSLILTKEECVALVVMTKSSKGYLV